MTLPLAGTRILAMTQVGAGPFAALQLADFGAEVIKIEDPAVGGDSTRGIPPFTEGGDSLFFQAVNRNNRSFTLNLRVPGGRAIFHELVRISDGLICNPRGDLVEKLGLNYAALGPVNPRFVCCAITGFGTTGPRAAQPAYDYLIQALAGIMSLTGEPDGPPARAGVSMIDFTAGLNAAIGTLLGLMRARATGRGGDVDVSLLESGLSLLNYVAVWTLNAGYVPERVAHSGHLSVVPCQNFETADGWIVVMCQKEAWWPRLCALMDLPDLATDPRFATFQDRYANRSTLLPILIDRFKQRPSAEWLVALEAAGIPSGPVNTVEEALREPQLEARGTIIGVDHPRFGQVRQIGPVVRLSGVETPRLPGPALGADTETILREYLGKSDDDIAALRAVRAI
ncbi:MAG TPA: CoA transferase [Dehalococcoidia bacterium]|nr:CoA transferase [Dehalococcoidia bacterium]